MKLEDFQSINPYTKEIEYTHEATALDHIEYKIKSAYQSHLDWANQSIEARKVPFKQLHQMLINLNESYAEIATREMGKPISQAKAELTKCASLITYYTDNADAFLQDEHINTEYYKSLVTYEPLGVILGVMPWNFPYWQIMRFAVPALLAGNSILIKPAPNVFQCARALEQLFQEAGFPKHLFQVLYIHHSLTPLVLKEHAVKGVAFTGSVNGGRAVAQIAAKYGKKSVLELGGSDPFIILEDANIDNALDALIPSRFSNAGQTCIAAKRLILVEEIVDIVLPKLKEKLAEIELGNPLNQEATMGPMAREDLVENIQNQVKKTVELGAKVFAGGKRRKDTNFFEPTILMDIPKDSPAYSEEMFGPVLSVFVVKNEQKAISLANDTTFGLGASLWTNDLKKGERLARKIKTGTVAVNKQVKSDPRLPFGGINDSGYGKELSLLGIREFTNTKVIVVD